MSSERIKELIKYRGTIKGKLTNFGNFVSQMSSLHGDITDIHFNEMECRLEKVSDLLEDFDKF